MDAEIKAAVVAKIEAGEYLEDFCGTGGIPSRSTVLRAQDADPDFDAQCVRARVQSAERSERRVSGIVDDVLAGEVEPDAARVAINGITWIAKVRAPRVYGDKVELAGSLTLDVAAVLADRKKSAA